MSLNNEIGERFSAALYQLGIKNKEISEIFDVSSQQISNLKKSSTISNLLSKICAHYGININWIVSGHGEMFTQEHSTVSQNIKHNPGMAIGNVQGDNIASGGGGIEAEIDDPVALALFVQAWKAAKQRGNAKELKIMLMDFCDDG